MALGDPPIRKPAPASPEWVTADNPKFERNARTGELRTKDHKPPADPLMDWMYGFPIVRPKG